MNYLADAKVGRRDFFRVLALGGAVAATTSAFTSADAADFPDKRRARYLANAPDIQTYYRVNRYPEKAGR